jgi:hypothetical protein
LREKLPPPILYASKRFEDPTATDFTSGEHELQLLGQKHESFYNTIIFRMDFPIVCDCVSVAFGLFSFSFVAHMIRGDGVVVNVKLFATAT